MRQLTRLFIMLPEFEKQWNRMGLTDDDLKRLQFELLENPQKGDVIQGTGGLRKIRFAFENRGKSGSSRVVYVDFAVYEKVFLITAYPKNEKDNLTNAERNNIKKMIEALEKSLKGE
ncbi:MAG: type II toxin-antitoxin system RelE/ParE family toxin [Oscillospiraceae bacterium]